MNAAEKWSSEKRWGFIRGAGDIIGQHGDLLMYGSMGPGRRANSEEEYTDSDGNKRWRAVKAGPYITFGSVFDELARALGCMMLEDSKSAVDLIEQLTALDRDADERVPQKASA